MKLVKRLIELAFGVFLLTLFALNSDVMISIRYYGLREPITVRFFELVLFCVSLGILLAAFGDFITQLRWIGERRRLVKKDKEHQAQVDNLTGRASEVEDENARLKRNNEALQKKVSDLEAAQAKAAETAPVNIEKSEEAPSSS
jgi:hypothetical protein